MNKNQLLLETIYMSNDLNVIQEGFGDVVKNFVSDPNKMKTLVSKLKSVKDVQTFRKMIGFIPKMDFKTIDGIAKNKINDYEQNKKIAEKELNSNIPVAFRKTLVSIVSMLGQDSGQVKSLAKQINKQRVDWDQVNANLIFRLCMLLIFSVIVASVNPDILPMYVGILLAINLVRYLIDMASYTIDDNSEDEQPQGFKPY